MLRAEQRRDGAAARLMEGAGTMAQPTRYEPSYDFSDFQQDNPTEPLPADKIDTELENIAETTDEICDNLALIQRDDGALANQIVTRESLDPDVLGGIGPDAVTAAETAVEAATTATEAADRAVAAAATSPINVMDTPYGAKGDGLADDTAAITAAFAAAVLAHRPVFFPPGTYKITSAIDLTGSNGTDENYYGASFYGVGWNAGPGFRKIASKIIQATDNTPIFKVWGPSKIYDLEMEYANQQTTSNTASIALALNNVSGSDIRNLRIWQAHISVGIVQAGFGVGTFNALWDSILANIDSYKASHTHFDLRNLNSGGTNTLLHKPYINGGGALDFSSLGQSCLYGIRGAQWNGYTMDGLSIDATTFTERLIDIDNAGNVFIPQLRFESCNCRKNGDGWIKFGGGAGHVRIGHIEMYRNRALVADVTTATYIIYANPTYMILDVGSLNIASNNDFPASTVNRILFVGTSDTVNSSYRIGPFYNAAPNLNSDAWSETFTSFPQVREFNGRFISRWLKSGASALTTKEFAGSAVPTAMPSVYGDRMVHVQPGDFGRPVASIVGSQGTPGTWAPYAWVGGQFTGTTNGDANLTLTPKISRGVYVFNVTLTATRTVTLSPTGATNGDIFVIERRAGGAFALNIGAGTPIGYLLAFEACLVRFDGTNWVWVGKWYIADGPSSVVAHKNGTDQTGVVTNTATKVTFATEDSDGQGLWDATNSRLVVLAPARYRVSATVHMAAANIVDQTQYSLLLYKNGALHRTLDVRQASGTGAFSLTGSATFFGDVTTPDVFEIYVKGGIAAEGDKTIEGDADKTFVCIEKLA